MHVSRTFFRLVYQTLPMRAYTMVFANINPSDFFVGRILRTIKALPMQSEWTILRAELMLWMLVIECDFGFVMAMYV